MVITRSRSASGNRAGADANTENREDDAIDAFPPAPSRPVSPSAFPAHENGGGDASRLHRAQSTTNATFSSEHLATIVDALQRSQTEALKSLFELSRVSVSTPVTTVASGNFARCTARFSGATNESLDAFLDAANAYKECCAIGDENAVRGLSLLLTDQAAVWWLGVKASVSTWGDAVTALRSAFGDRRPPHRIYVELFRRRQEQGERTERFVAGARALLARLPPGDLTEKVQIDMVYGLLSSRVRERLRRDEVDSFVTLLHRARQIEDATDEASQQSQQQRTTLGAAVGHPSAASAGRARQPAATSSAPSARVPPQHAAAAAGPSPVPQLAAARGPSQNPPVATAPANTASSTSSGTSADITTGRKPRPQCAYCRKFGHERHQCRKLENQSEKTFYSVNSHNSDKNDNEFSIPLKSKSGDACIKFLASPPRQTLFPQNYNFPNQGSCVLSMPRNQKVTDNARNLTSSKMHTDSFQQGSREITACNTKCFCGYERALTDKNVCDNTSMCLCVHSVNPLPAATPQSLSYTSADGDNNRCNVNTLPTKVSHQCEILCPFSENGNKENVNPLCACSGNVNPLVDVSGNVFDLFPGSKNVKPTSADMENVNSSSVKTENKGDDRFNIFSADGNIPYQKVVEYPIQKLCNCKMLKSVDSPKQKGCNCKMLKNVDDFKHKECDCKILTNVDGHMQNENNSFFSENGNVLNSSQNSFINCSSGDYDSAGPSIGRDVRPIFNINILGFNGTALVDTAAKHCIAGHTLYALLLQQNHPLRVSSQRVKLADGVVRIMEVFTTTLEVRLETKTITTPFLIFPHANNNETLLGIDFITAAGVLIDFKNELWYFSGNDKVQQQYNLCFEPKSRGVSCASTTVLRDDEGTHLSPDEREALSSVLSRHERVFRAGGGPCPFTEHRIETGEHPPISVPPYRLNPSKKQKMKEEIDKMLQDDIIEECESAWCSPALLVPKPNGDIRFCVDYRRLNAITKSDSYPMPCIDELLQSTKRDCYMTTLDLRSSYWQVIVREADRDKTAFVCPLGTFRFKRMPFGLRNAPATFQRLIDRLRSCSALQEVTLLCYLDDLLIISEGYQRHLQDLEAVFERLAEFNLHLNREKCFFARESVKYLGHVITQEGVSTDPGKVSAVLEMKEPGNLKHLRTFLQTCSWFRKFIPNFSKVAEPLTRLTRKNQVWIWGSEQYQAFNELKRLLTTAPILVQADFSRPFILRTDASNYALGAVLLQGDGNQERPIEYASRLLNSAERNYSTTEREALAVVWAVERFRPYLDSHPVIIGSDHQPLRWLLSLKSPTGRLVRWALKLQAFDIQFQYTPGKANVVADTLSRPICSDESREDCGVCSVICDLPSKSPSQIRKEQISDPDVEKVIKELEGTDETAAQRWVDRGYLMDQGVVYRFNPDSDSESPQLVVPASQVPVILKELHDSPTACHPGIDRTYQKVAQSYYFTGMRRIITDYVKACIQCQRYKASNAKPPGLLQTPVMNQRNEVLAIDLFGPLPEGDQGERWILLVEDTATRWTEIFALKEATAGTCARLLIEEFFMRYGLPRRIISDNGVQFVSAVMRQCMSVLDIKQNLVPLYHPESNPAERKNRDLKAMLAYLVEEDHTSWPKKLPVIRFALNSANCRTTGKSPAYLTFGREMRSPIEVVHDLRGIMDKENFVPQITPYLRNFLNSLAAVRERVESQQDCAKQNADISRRPSEHFKVGDLVLLKSHLLSKASKDLTAKFFPRRDGPYRIVKKVSPTTYEIANTEQPDVIGKYHTKDITRYTGDSLPKPVIPKRKRGRPAKADAVLVPERGRSPGLEGEYIATQHLAIPSNRPTRGSRGRNPVRYPTSGGT